MRSLVASVVLCAACVVSTSVFAQKCGCSRGCGSSDSDELVYGMHEKGTHGIVDAATGWWEIPSQIQKGYERGVGKPTIKKTPAGSRSLGAFLGVFRGVGHAAGRTAWGVLEFGGFWTRNPTTNEDLRQLLDSEYSWEEGTRKEMKCPRLEDGVKKMGARAKRGFKNTVGAVAEVPGQFAKGDRERCCIAKSATRAVWFSASRAIYGAGDLALFPLASRDKCYGVAFDEVEPWDALRGRDYNNRK